MTTAYRKLDKLKEPFKTKVEGWLKEVNKEKEIIFITETWRSEERQQELIYKWLSKVPHSKHQDWLAVDIAFNSNNSDWLYPEDINKWKAIWKIANKYWIDWWYDLWEWDKPHFQDNNLPIPLVNKKEPMEQFWKNITINWLTFPSSIYWIRVELRKWLDRTWMLKLHWATTSWKSYILLSDYTINKWEDKVKEVLLHEFSHLIYHTQIKTSIFEKIDNTDYKLTKYEYWDYISRNLKHYITDYAKTHSAEDFAELIWYWWYIENNLNLPSKATWNDEVKFKWIVANNLYKRGLETYLKSI